jgi:hypothetical protein
MRIDLHLLAKTAAVLAALQAFSLGRLLEVDPSLGAIVTAGVYLLVQPLARASFLSLSTLPTAAPRALARK